MKYPVLFTNCLWITLSPPQTVSHWLHFPVLEFLHGKQATNLQTEILRPDHRMARLTSLQWEMRVLGCILLVYFSTGTRFYRINILKQV